MGHTMVKKIKLGQNGSKWGQNRVKLGQNGEKLIKMDQNRVKLAQTGYKEGQHGPQWVKIGSKWDQKRVNIGQNRVQNGSKHVKMVSLARRVMFLRRSGALLFRKKWRYQLSWSENGQKMAYRLPKNGQKREVP